MRKLRTLAGIFIVFALMSVTYRVGIVEAQSYPGYYKYLLYALNSAGNPIALSTNGSGNLVMASGVGNGFAAGIQPPKGYYPSLMYGLNAGSPIAASVDGTGAMITTIGGGGQAFTGPVTVSIPTSGSFNTPLSALVPDLTSGQCAQTFIGRDATTDHIGVVVYCYDSSVPNNNVIGLGLYGISRTLSVFPTGVSINTTAPSGYALDVAGIVRNQGLIAGGTTFTVTGCGTATALAGGAMGGKFVGASTTCNPVITPGITAPSGFSCWANDLTTNITFRQTAYTTTTATMTASATAGATDQITIGCTAF